MDIVNEHGGFEVLVKVVDDRLRTDAEAFRNSGVPAAIYLSDEKHRNYYRNFWHKEGDTMTAFQKDDIDSVAALFAAIAYLYADLDIDHF